MMTPIAGHKKTTQKQSGKKDGHKSRKGVMKANAFPARVALPASGLAEEVIGTEATGIGGECSAGDRNPDAAAMRGPSGHRQGREAAAKSPEVNRQVAEEQTNRGESGGHRPPDHESAAHDTDRHLHLVTFNLDREEYGVAIDRVQEIIRVGQITPVPNIPEYIRGVINLRGRIIPVLDLRKKLHLPEGERTKNSRIMIVEAGLKILGMLVDGVSQVFWLPMISIEEAPRESERAKGYVKSIGKHDSRLILLIDLDRVLEKEIQQSVD